jgi:hypothetical protein
VKQKQAVHVVGLHAKQVLAHEPLVDVQPNVAERVALVVVGVVLADGDVVRTVIWRVQSGEQARRVRTEIRVAHCDLGNVCIYLCVFELYRTSTKQ